MTTKQGDLSLLNDPVAQQLLQSTNPARLAYVWKDGTPRVVPIWFYWNGKEVVLGGPAAAPKVEALQQNPHVALTIDDASTWPYKELVIRGTASVEIVDGVPAEYAAAAERYFGPEQGKAWAGQVGQMSPQAYRIKITPTWVGIIDFETRFPSAIQKAIEAAQQG
ncbi:MAG: pyridoxamine 5'-phosphate oxidase family protein [Anaerolineae bacterium]